MAPKDWPAAAPVGTRRPRGRGASAVLLASMDSLRDSLTMTVATVRGKSCRIKGGVVEGAVVVEPDPAHAAPGRIDSPKLCGRLGDNLSNPRRPGADVTGKPSEVVNGVVELPVEVDALVGSCFDSFLKP